MRLLAVVPLVLLLSAPVQAQSFSLGLTAEGTGRWYEYFSDAFAQIDREPDGFYLISQLPNFVPVGGGANVFPSEGNFADLGTIGYSTITGVGHETATITSLDLDFAPYIAYTDALVNQPYTTSFTGFSGTVDLFNGAVTAVNLASDIRFTYDFSGFGFGLADYDGTFSITGSRFDLFVDGTYPTPFPDPMRYVWDFEGDVQNLAPVPEPSTYLMLLAGLGVIGATALRRRA